MRSLQAMAVLLGTLSVVAFTPGVASAQAPASAAGKVAVIDIAKIFREHQGIKYQIEQVNATMKEYETAIQAKQDEIRQAAGALKQYKVGTPEYAAQEEKIAEMDSKLRLDATRHKKELADREAKIYFENYQTISDIVRQIAEYNQISLVLRYNSEQMDLENPDTVLRAVMKNVVYNDARIDLTDTVMKVLDDKLRTAARPAGQARQ